MKVCSRIFSFILVLFVLFSCSMPFIPVSAADAVSPPVSGDWVFNSEIIWGEYVSFNMPFSAGGLTFSGMQWDEEREQLFYLTEDTEGCVYDGLNGGWFNSEAATISISTDAQLDENAYAFFTGNASIALPVYTNVIYIGDSSFGFSDRGASPTVNIEVTSSGCTLSAGEHTMYWTYQGDGEFLGFAINDDGVLTIPVGLTTTCRGLSGDHHSYRLYPCVDDGSSGGGSSPEDFYHLSGEWKFTGKIYWDEDLTIDIPFGSAEYECSSILWDAEREQLWFVTPDNDLCVYDGTSGWTHTEFMTILVDGDIQITEAAYDFFTSNAVQISDGGDSGGSGDVVPEYVIPSGYWQVETYIMTGEIRPLDSWPAMLQKEDFSFTSNGVSYSSMQCLLDPSTGDALFYDATMAYAYNTLKLDQAPQFVNSAFSVLHVAADQEVSAAFYNWFMANFTSSSTSPSLTYTTTVNIYDSTGLVLYRTFSFRSEGAAPVARLRVTTNGCEIMCGNEVKSWVSLSGAFHGLSLSPGLTASFVSDGGIYSLPSGGQSDVTIKLYCAKASDDDTDSGSVTSTIMGGFVSALLDPVMAFFSVEFIPGFSFGKIALVAFVIGLVFWFLKISKS